MFCVYFIILKYPVWDLYGPNNIIRTVVNVIWWANFQKLLENESWCDSSRPVSWSHTSYKLNTYTTHNGSIIASIMHYMHAKSWYDIIINKEKCECNIISWYCIIARQSKKISDKYILYTYLYWDSKK
jgi:hypothetical protein